MTKRIELVGNYMKVLLAVSTRPHALSRSTIRTDVGESLI
jgi:hypothetical protein